MTSFRIKFFVNTVIILALIFGGYYYRAEIKNAYLTFQNKMEPCQKPILYSIGNIDPRFGLTKEELIKDINMVEKIWETPINRQLFQYSETGGLVINFIYDYRQEATVAMSKIGVVINDDRATYDTLKAKYNLLNTQYDTDKAKLDALTASYNRAKMAYEREVSSWNKKGGAPKTEYNILEQKRVDLNRQISLINEKGDSLNQLVDLINSVRIILNKLITELNLQVDKYNTTGASVGKTFNEGEYTSDSRGAAISIFQFSNDSQLTRVLAHELGHALGLDHIDNSKAIMYYLNEGLNEKLTADDLTALKNICGIQ